MANTPVKNYRVKKWATDRMDELVASGYGKNQTAVIHRLIAESIRGHVREKELEVFVTSESSLRASTQKKLDHTLAVIEWLRAENLKLVDEVVALKLYVEVDQITGLQRELAELRAANGRSGSVP